MGWEATPVSDEAGLAHLDRQGQGAEAARPAGRATAHAMLGLDRTDRQRNRDSIDRVRPGGDRLYRARRPRLATAECPRHLVAGMARRRSRAEDDQGQADVRGNSRAVDSRQREQRDGHGPAGRESPRHPARHLQPGIRQAAGHGRSERHGQRLAQASAEDRRAERDGLAQRIAGLRHGQAFDGRRKGLRPVHGLPGHGQCETGAHAALRRLDAAAGPGPDGRLRGRSVRGHLDDDDQLPAGPARLHERPRARNGQEPADRIPLHQRHAAGRFRPAARPLHPAEPLRIRAGRLDASALARRRAGHAGAFHRAQLKVIDAQDFTGQGDMPLVEADLTSKDGKDVFENEDKGYSVFTDKNKMLKSADDNYWISVLNETHLMNSGSGAQDLNGNGSKRR